ncbi:MAG: hypothetical protein ACOY0T_28585 [Myxococcota bacterium]
MNSGANLVGSFTASDQSDLKTLAICHYAYAALLAFGGLVPVVMVLFGVGLVTSLAATASGTTTPAADVAAGGFMVGGVLLVIMGAVTFLVWVKAGLVLFSGLSLRRGKHRTLSQVVAALCCLNVPLGTLLGVFTLMVLARPSVRAGYDYNANALVRGH